MARAGREGDFGTAVTTDRAVQARRTRVPPALRSFRTVDGPHQHALTLTNRQEVLRLGLSTFRYDQIPVGREAACSQRAPFPERVSRAVCPRRAHRRRSTRFGADFGLDKPFDIEPRPSSPKGKSYPWSDAKGPEACSRPFLDRIKRGPLQTDWNQSGVSILGIEESFGFSRFGCRSTVGVMRSVRLEKKRHRFSLRLGSGLHPAGGQLAGAERDEPFPPARHHPGGPGRSRPSPDRHQSRLGTPSRPAAGRDPIGRC